MRLWGAAHADLKRTLWPFRKRSADLAPYRPTFNHYADKDRRFTLRKNVDLRLDVWFLINYALPVVSRFVAA
jgi:hypothetical protein